MGRFVFIKCPTCGGSGWVRHWEPGMDGVDHPCYTCVGTGEVAVFQDDELTSYRGEIW